MSQPNRYGTIAGVFTPTLLTILGVIMYLRLGWVVGNAGLLGGWLIMALAIGITTATGLSLSSIATNTRIGAGGPYAVIRKSLGLEVGGSVGVPLYLSQAVAVTMYIFGLREGWLWIFPEHSPLVIDLVVFAVVVSIGATSARLAFRVQYVIMAIIAVSLVLIFAAPLEPIPSEAQVPLWGTWPGSPDNDFSGTDFWVVFAVFFPAATGITVGANMSGELEDPRRSIARGTLSAIGISTVIYFVLAWWLTRLASVDELVANYTVLIDRAAWRPGVLAGLIGATFSSALAAFVGAPRILQAVAADGVLPGGTALSELAANGEPRRATAVTAVIVLIGLLLRDLNAVAPLVTMFFLIAYAVLNIIVVIESSLRLVSYRPTLRMPPFVAWLGASGCLVAMFVVNPTFSIMALLLVGVLYAWLMGRGIEDHAEDVRSGLFVALAEWAARKASKVDVINVRAWKPNFLVPVRDPVELRGEFRLLSSLSRPEGSLKLLGIRTPDRPDDFPERVRVLARAMARQSGVFTRSSIIDAPTYMSGVVAGMQALVGTFFRPNTLVLPLPINPAEDDVVRDAMRVAQAHDIGLMVMGLHPVAGLGRMHVINLWLHPQDAEEQVEQAFDRSNLDLALLLSYRLARDWDAELNLMTVVRDAAWTEGARFYLEEIVERTRLPKRTQIHVMVGDFWTGLREAPQSDIDVFGISDLPDPEFMRKTLVETRSACLFASDSGSESAFA